MADQRPDEITHLRLQLTSLVRRMRLEDQSDEKSWSRLRLLVAIDRQGGEATPSMLAASERMRSSNLAAALRELEVGGLIVRNADATDRRKVRIALTGPGRRLLHTSRARREHWLAEAMQACLSARERARLIEVGHLMERVARFAEPLASARPP